MMMYTFLHANKRPVFWWCVFTFVFVSAFCVIYLWLFHRIILQFDSYDVSFALHCMKSQNKHTFNPHIQVHFTFLLLVFLFLLWLKATQSAARIYHLMTKNWAPKLSFDFFFKFKYSFIFLLSVAVSLFVHN